jgi:hypothetical protein
MENTNLNLTEITNQITALSAQVEALDSAALTDEVATVEKLLALARVGMRPSRIPIEIRSHNCNTCHHPNQTTYSDLRGVKFLSCDCEDETRDGTSRYDHRHEVWITADGLLFGDDCDPISYWQNAWNTETRTLTPYTVQELVKEWGLKLVVPAVQDLLTKRLERLGARSASAAKRAETAAKVRAAL